MYFISLQFFVCDMPCLRYQRKNVFQKVVDADDDDDDKKTS